MQVTAEQLLTVIGNLYVELMMARSEIERMKQAEKDHVDEKKQPDLKTVK